MPKVLKSAEFGRVFYSILILAAVCFVAYAFVLPASKVGAQKFDAKKVKSSEAEPLATTTFPATGLPVEIPDITPAGVNISIPVMGLTDQVRGVSVILTFDNGGGTPSLGHTYIGDLTATLMSPPPANSHLLFSRVGNTSGVGTSGDSSNAVGPYTFTDGSTGDIWVAASAPTTNDPVPSGSYRTTACCAAATGGPAILTKMNPVFQGPALSDMPVDNVGNGTWTLNISDNSSGDTGRVSGLNLTITTLAPTAARASIRGIVATPSGRPIAYARVSILNAETLETQTVTTNQFGLFNFDNLPVENFYNMWVEHGRYQFAAPVQSFVLVGDIFDAKFISTN